MKETCANQSCITLVRGGILIPTSIGNIQFGIPPETIKDSMQLEGGVPQIYIAPEFMFDLDHGIALAEMEFPIYYNYFLQNKKTRIVCTENQKKNIASVISESLFGPDQFDISGDFIQGEKAFGFPDLRSEMNYFRSMNPEHRRTELDDFIEFILLDKDRTARIGAVEIRISNDYDLTVFDQGKKIAHIERSRPLIQNQQCQATGATFIPPVFGVTTLGAGHGFDPAADTSGMIIWVSRRGIIVDPPVNSMEKLLCLGVSPKLIDNLILTHCHADHDAGTLQKLLQEGKLNIFTTATIFNSFMKKSANLSGLDEKILRSLVHFFPVRIGEPMRINGGKFSFQYTLHSIPTISIRVQAFGKSMVYSSDTMNEPIHTEKLYQDKIINRERRDILLGFPWDDSVIFHEAGLPPIHTPLDYLCSLPEDVRERLFLVHVAENSIPAGSGLRVAPTGLTNTLELVNEPMPHEDVIETLDALSHVIFFKELPIKKVREFLIIAKKVTISAGETLFNKDDQADCFYIIVRGRIDIVANKKILTSYSDSDYFGEKTLFAEQLRTADAVAASDTRLLAIKNQDMLGFIRGTDSEEILQHIAEFQDEKLRNAFNKNKILSSLTPSQQTQLISITSPVPETFPPGSILLAPDESREHCYMIKQGRVGVYRGDAMVSFFDTGALFGVQGTLDQKYYHDAYLYKAEEDVLLYKINKAELKNYLEKNPGVYIKLFHYRY